MTVAMSVVYELPPRDSCSSLVSLESLYGMYLHRSHARSEVCQQPRPIGRSTRVGLGSGPLRTQAHTGDRRPAAHGIRHTSTLNGSSRSRNVTESDARRFGKRRSHAKERKCTHE